MGVIHSSSQCLKTAPRNSTTHPPVYPFKQKQLLESALFFQLQSTSRFSASYSNTPEDGCGGAVSLIEKSYRKRQDFLSFLLS